MTVTIHTGDALEVLATLPAGSAHCCVTSPPYWNLRDYGVEGQIGLEKTPEEYVKRLVEVFRAVWRVLREDGTLWVNLGDSYATRWRSRRDRGGAGIRESSRDRQGAVPEGLKHKDLIGIPWRVAFAFQADGWHLRSDIIWSKPNPMPESVVDRPTKAHEYLFLLSKSPQYYFDAEAVREKAEARPLSSWGERKAHEPMRRGDPGESGQINRTATLASHPGRNIRTVWTIATHPFPSAHFATFPPRLVEPCIKAATSEKGCCSICGASWEREVDREFVPQGDVSPEKLLKGSLKGMDQSSGWAETPRGAVTTRTTGWASACSCHAGIPLDPWEDPSTTNPCTVLDPFGGRRDDWPRGRPPRPERGADRAQPRVCRDGPAAHQR